MESGGKIMKRRIILSVAFTLSVVLISLTRSDSTRAEPPATFMAVADTGVVKLGADQELRITGDWNGDGTVGLRFRWMEYMQGPCNGGVCQLTVSSQNISAPMALMPGEALSVAVDPSDTSGNTYARGVVLSSNKNVIVTAEIIDITTGKVISHIIMANTEGDFH
jgi:hypothetical protein